MTVLITGSNGFIGSYLAKRIPSNINTTRQDFNLLDKKSTHKFLHCYKPDIIIHCASVGGRRLKEDDASVLYENILMFENLSTTEIPIINLGSGAAYDRRNNLVCATEDAFKTAVPIDYYGLAKNIIAKECLRTNAINLTIFNCFGLLEKDGRFVKEAIKYILNPAKDQFHITNRLMDFLYIEDLYKIVMFCIDNFYNLPSNINCVYPYHYTILEIYEIICWIASKYHNCYFSPPNIVDGGLAYSGSCSTLYQYPKFIGLEKGLEETYKWLSSMV